MIATLIFDSGGKKFILAGAFILFVCITATVLLCVGMISPEQWLVALDKALWAVGGYLGFNVAQKVGDAFGDRTPTPPPDGGGK